MSSKTLRAGLSLVLAAMTLAGCASYSGLNTEGVSLDAKNLKAGQSLSGVTLSPAAWPKSDWWKSLGDPQLDGLIREALHDSPDMQIADARAHQASAAAYAADAARMRAWHEIKTRAGRAVRIPPCATSAPVSITTSTSGAVSGMPGKQHWARPVRRKSISRPRS
jgi:outer membrane protein TolC